MFPGFTTIWNFFSEFGLCRQWAPAINIASDTLWNCSEISAIWVRYSRIIAVSAQNRNCEVWVIIWLSLWVSYDNRYYLREKLFFAIYPLPQSASLTAPSRRGPLARLQRCRFCQSLPLWRRWQRVAMTEGVVNRRGNHCLVLRLPRKGRAKRL